MVAVSLEPRFPLGRMVVTPAVLAQIHPHDVTRALGRHGRGDWGELSPDDWRENDRALQLGGRLVSAYRDARGTRFWIITESDRSQTTILLPEDY